MFRLLPQNFWFELIYHSATVTLTLWPYPLAVSSHYSTAVKSFDKGYLFECRPVPTWERPQRVQAINLKHSLPCQKNSK